MIIQERLTFGQTYVVQSDGPIKITQTGAHGTLVKVNVTDEAGTAGREVVFTAIDTAAEVEVDEGTNWSCVPGFNRGAASVQGSAEELPTDQKTFLQWVTDGKLTFDSKGRLQIATSVDATGTFNHDGYASNYVKTIDGVKYTTTVNATEVTVKKSVAGVETVLMHLHDGVLELGGKRVLTENAFQAQIARAMFAAEHQPQATSFRECIERFPDCIQDDVLVTKTRYLVTRNSSRLWEDPILGNACRMPDGDTRNPSTVIIQIVSTAYDTWDYRWTFYFPGAKIFFTTSGTSDGAQFRTTSYSHWGELHWAYNHALRFGNDDVELVQPRPENCGPVYITCNSASVSGSGMSGVWYLHDIFINAPYLSATSISIFGSNCRGSAYGAPLSEASIIYAVKHVGVYTDSITRTIKLGIDKNLVAYDDEPTDGKLIIINTADNTQSFVDPQGELATACAARPSVTFSFIPSY